MICHAHPFNPQFMIGGIFCALDNVLCLAADKKQRIWFVYINGWFFFGKWLKKARIPHGDVMVLALN